MNTQQPPSIAESKSSWKPSGSRHYGYSKTTMADIADGCNMSAANLYASSPPNWRSSRRSAPGSPLNPKGCFTRSCVPTRLHRCVWSDHKTNAPTHAENCLTIVGHEMFVVAMEEQWHAVRAHLDRIACISVNHQGWYRRGRVSAAGRAAGGKVRAQRFAVFAIR